MIAFSRYAPNLDDLLWFEDIYFGEINFFYNAGGSPREGRFYPFANVDLLLLMKISHSPYLFFGVNAMLCVIFCVIYLKILDSSNGKNALNSAIIALFIMSAGFVRVFFGICYPEKLQIIWIALFMLFSLRVTQNPTPKNQLFGIIFLNIALYYKEPLFIAALAFGAVLLMYAISNHCKDLRKYAIYIIASALLYVALYVLLILAFWSVETYYKQHSFSYARDLTSFVINDSLIAFGFGGILLYRIYAVFVKKARIEPFFDGFLVASLAYLSVFIVLKMYDSYYLLPCYAFGIPAFIYFGRKYGRVLFIKICVILGLLGFFMQNLPQGIYNMIDLKAQGVQFHRTLDFIASYLKENKSAKVYVYGSGRGKQLYGYDVQIYSFHLVKYAISMRGVDGNAWDILRTNALYNDKADNFSVEFDTPKSGDLMIVNNKSVFGDSLKKARENGELLFKSGFSSVPYIALLPFTQYISAKYFSVNLSGGRTNFFRLPRETYIFRAK